MRSCASRMRNCRSGMTEKIERDQQNGATSKSLPIFGNNVKAQNKKYFALSEGQIRAISTAIPSRSEGRWPSSQRGTGMRWTRKLQLTSAAEAYGEDVWS